MFDPARFLLFVIASVILIVTPGPAVLYIIARGLSQGRRAAVVSSVGIAVGNLGHVLGAALGLSAVLASSALAYSVVQYLGAGYLFFLGLRKLLQPPVATAAPPPGRPGHVFRQGVLVGLLNPKAALFFLAFIPQFADPARGAVWLQLLVLGLVFVALAVIGDGTYALLSGTLGRRLQQRKEFARVGRLASGGIYCGLGLVAALSGHGRSH